MSRDSHSDEIVAIELTPEDGCADPAARPDDRTRGHSSVFDVTASSPIEEIVAEASRLQRPALGSTTYRVSHSVRHPILVIPR